MLRHSMQRLYLGIFLVSLTTLMTELILIRVFDVILTTNIGYMIITCAMFSFGLAGVCATFIPNPFHGKIREFLAVLAFAFSGFILFIVPIMNSLPFDLKKIVDAPLVQAAAFGGMYGALVIPFFLSGLLIAVLISAYPEDIQALYFWDLLGAAVGC